MITAIQFEELDNGNEASLDEKPNNGVEVTPGGPFLMRILHQKYVRNPTFFLLLFLLVKISRLKYTQVLSFQALLVKKDDTEITYVE